MSQVIVLIPIALFLGLVGLVAFVWSIKTGQYDDLQGAAERILDDGDDRPAERRDASERAAARRYWHAVTGPSQASRLRSSTRECLTCVKDSLRPEQDNNLIETVKGRDVSWPTRPFSLNCHLPPVPRRC